MVEREENNQGEGKKGKRKIEDGAFLLFVLKGGKEALPLLSPSEGGRKRKGKGSRLSLQCPCGKGKRGGGRGGGNYLLTFCLSSTEKGKRRESHGKKKKGSRKKESYHPFLGKGKGKGGKCPP